MSSLPLRFVTKPNGTKISQYVPFNLRRFNNLIEAWFQAIDKYCALADTDDAPYWYNERANISLLAGAAWLCGMAALEEYPIDKKPKREWKSGRSDLYLTWGKDHCVMESKVCWYPEQNLKSKLELAVQDAHANHDTDMAFACVFVVPGYQAGRTKNTTEFVRHISEECLETDILAACFPAGRQNLKSPSDGKLYPGVAMVLRRVRY